MARYLKIEEEKLLKESRIRNHMDRYGLERKFNKMDQYSFLCSCIKDTNLNFYDNNTEYLYESNYKKEFYRLMVLLYNKIKIDKRELAIKIAKCIISKSSNFIINIDNIDSIYLITEMYEYRLNDIENWDPKNKSKHGIMGDLLHYLFASYKVPNYLVNLFNRHDLEVGYLFHYIGTGKSLKGFPFIPNFVMGKKAYHHIYDTPVGYSYNESFRRAQIKDLGGDDNLVETLLGSKLGGETNRPDKVREEFWLTVIKFFISLDMVNPDKISEIIDYIYDQKFEIKRRAISFETYIEQPNFSMSGRNIVSLLRQSDEWHYLSTLNATREKTIVSWNPVNINDYEFDNSDNLYKIKQLTSTKELIGEGKSMHNCVASYASSCVKGMCSIFTLRISNHKKGLFDSSVATIEVRNRKLVQVKGIMNKKLDSYPTQLIKDWVNKENLSIGTFCGI